MTFTEAAVEVLRRAGKPLHFKDIAELAIQGSLLSHVGQDPEVTMGQRLAAMAKREDDRKVVAIAPEGTFALLEWGVAPETIIEPVAPPLSPPEPEGLYRAREREPRAINAQARKRLQELQAEHEPGSVLAEETAKAAVEERERLQQRKKEPRGGGQRRFPPPAEVVFEWLAQRQSGARLTEMAEALLEKNLLSDALTRDLSSLTAALLEDNRRRTEAGRKPAFIVDGERVTLVEFPAPPVAGEPAAALEGRSPHSGLGRPPTGQQLLAETRRAVVRALRRRTADMDTGAFEHLCAALLEKMGMRDVRVAKRGKEGPLYLARQRRGVSDLRVAVRLVRGQREISRGDVQELRKDLAHYSAQMGLVLAPGEAGREARAEASAAGQPPVALYAGDALAEEMVALRVGVSVQVVELVDVDEAFFASALRGNQGSEERRPRREMRAGEPQPEAPHEDDRPERHPEPQPEAARAPEQAAAAEQPEPVAQGKVAENVAAPAASASEGPAAAPAASAGEAVAGSEAGAVQSAPREREERDEEGRGRGRGRGRRPEPEREQERRPALPAEQAWGQPAGTPRRPGVPFAPLSMDPAAGGHSGSLDLGAPDANAGSPARAQSESDVQGKSETPGERIDHGERANQPEGAGPVEGAPAERSDGKSPAAGSSAEAEGGARESDAAASSSGEP